MKISMHRMERQQLLTVIAGASASLAGHDLFPFNPDEKRALELRLNIAMELINEKNEANRLIIDTLSEENAALERLAATHRENNYYKVYADRGDSYDHSPKLLQKLLECTTEDDVQQWHCDRLCEVEDNCESNDWGQEEEYWMDWWKDDLGCEESPDWDIFREWLREKELYMYYDCSDVVDTALRHTNAKVVATPHLANGDVIFAPHYEQDDDMNKDCIAILNRLFDMDLKFSEPQHWPDPNYSESRMVFMGDLDWLDIVRTKKAPNKLTVSKGDYHVFHASWNGSGSCREAKIRRNIVTVRATYHIDGINKYGVDETYGFTHSVWRDEHAATRQEWADDVEALTQDSKGRNRKLKVK